MILYELLPPVAALLPNPSGATKATKLIVAARSVCVNMCIKAEPIYWILRIEKEGIEIIVICFVDGVLVCALRVLLLWFVDHARILSFSYFTITTTTTIVVLDSVPRRMVDYMLCSVFAISFWIDAESMCMCVCVECVYK